jgi:hypothetical protein
VSGRQWITAILGVVGAALAIHFGWTFPWSRTLDLLADCNWELLTAAGLVNIVSLMAKAAAWYILLAEAAPLRIWTAQTATFVGAAVNSVSISIGGDVVRAQLASERDAVPFGMSAAALVVSRFVEAVALFHWLRSRGWCFPLAVAGEWRLQQSWCWWRLSSSGGVGRRGNGPKALPRGGAVSSPSSSAGSGAELRLPWAVLC